MDAHVRVATLILLLGLPPGAALSQSGSAPDYSAGCTSSGCHDGFAKFPVVHQPVADQTCDACHEAAESAEHRFEFIAAPTELCFECHKDVTEDFAVLHGPAAAGQCTACHRSHSSPHANLLVTESEKLCARCHSEFDARLRDAAHVHAALGQGCSTCHNPHGSNHPMVLNEALPALCVDCHDDVADAIDDATVPHAPMSDTASCAACHNPHMSEFEGLLKARSMDLCLSCHNRDTDPNGHPSTNMARLLAENKNHHGPIRKGICTACHEPHGATRELLLADSFPSTLYSPFDLDHYGLCFSCHEPSLVVVKRSWQQTGFRNGDQNLHYLHVNRPTKGRTCRACHDVHAGEGPHMAESVQFGERRIPVGFEATATGGTCTTACHRPYRYDRVKAVQNVAD